MGNRDFFPDALVTEARRDLNEVLGTAGVDVVWPGESETKLGGIETYGEAEAAAALFRKAADRIDGILVCLPNFGDEKGVADTIRLSGLRVPILVQAYPDELDQLTPARRRDAFCGKISVCNNLRQRGYPFSLTRAHTVHPRRQAFEADLDRFIRLCRVVRGLREVRLGAVGARPAAFNTVRYSEKILERSGITVTTVDLSEILGEAEKLGAEDPRVRRTLTSMEGYAPMEAVPQNKRLQMARLDCALRDWMGSNRIDATAIQCWTSLQQNWGCNVCTSMSMMSESLMPSACEVDVTGVLSMYALQLASGSPSALVDWNNNYAEDPDKCVLFHCGNWAKHFQPEGRVANAPILGSTLGVENTYGAMEGRTPAGALTFARLSTDDTAGRIRGYVGEGHLTDDPLKTFGNRAVAHVGGLNALLRYVCLNGFEHHVAVNLSHTAEILAEAFTTYLGWDTHVHQASH